VSDERDGPLGDALRRLPTPAHRPSFFAELEDRLCDEWTMPSRTGRMVRSVLRAHGRRALVTATAVAVLVTAGVVAAEARRGAGPAGPPAESVLTAPAPAAAPATPVTAGPAAPPADSGPGAVPVITAVRVDASGFDPVHGSWHATYFVSGDGRYRRVEADGAQTVEDTTAGTSQAVTVDGRGRVTVTSETGSAPGPTDGPDDLSQLQRPLGWTVRALAAAGNPAVTAVSYAGRPAWHFETTVRPSPTEPGSPDSLEAVVDEATALPLQVDGRRLGRLVSRLQVSSIVAEPVLTAADLGLRLPAGVRAPAAVDGGWQRIAPSRTAQAAGFAPWMPGLLPSGFTLSDVAVRMAPRADRDDGVSVTVTYRRGIDVLWVTTTVPPRQGAETDPLATGAPGGSQRLGDVTISIAPGEVPHLFAIRGGQVLTASGGVTGDDLLTLARTLPCQGAQCTITPP
jgi:hypothetical protein